MPADADAFELDENPAPVNPPAAIREVEQKDFVETFTVNAHGKKYEVAANALANRAMMQVTVAKLRSLCERALKPFDDEEIIPTPKELKVLTEAVSLVNDMSEAAYGDTKKGGNLANALERMAYGMTRGAVEAGKAHSQSPEAKLNRLENMKRVGSARRKESAAIDVTPAT